MATPKDSNGKIDFKKAIKRTDSIIQGLVGCNAPHFNVIAIDGKSLSLSKLTGKIIVLNFWFSSCTPCVKELPALNNLVKYYKGKDVVFIAFSEDDTTVMKNFLQSHLFDYNIVSSEYDMSERFCLIGGYPTNMVIDKKGVVRQIFCGGFTDDERGNTVAYDKMKPTIDKYLSEQ